MGFGSKEEFAREKARRTREKEDGKYGRRLAARGFKHRRYLESLADLPSLETAREEYEFALRKLHEHELSGCKGCRI